MLRSALPTYLAKGLVITLLAGTATQAQQEQQPEDTSWYQQIQVNGFGSAAYTYNANSPSSKLNGFRIFDDRANHLNGDVAELVVQRAIAKPNQLGFRVDVTAGNSIPLKTKAAGMDWGRSLDLQQALLSYIAPLGAGLRLDAGKFVTPLGMELIEGFDGYNDQYSRSLLFNYAIPLTHTGVRASYPISAAATLSAMVVQGWDNVKDNNSRKSGHVTLALVPATDVSVALNYMAGPEQAGNNDALRQIFDVVAIWKLTKMYSLGANYDYGTEAEASQLPAGGRASWRGFAGYGKVEGIGPFQIALRAEQFDDMDGARLGLTQSTRLREVTLTPAYRVTHNLLIRAEFRHDRANTALFETSTTAPARRQSTVGLNALVMF